MLSFLAKTLQDFQLKLKMETKENDFLPALYVSDCCGPERLEPHQLFVSSFPVSRYSSLRCIIEKQLSCLPEGATCMWVVLLPQRPHLPAVTKRDSNKTKNRHDAYDAVSLSCCSCWTLRSCPNLNVCLFACPRHVLETVSICLLGSSDSVNSPSITSSAHR